MNKPTTVHVEDQFGRWPGDASWEAYKAKEMDVYLASLEARLARRDKAILALKKELSNVRGIHWRLSNMGYGPDNVQENL